MMQRTGDDLERLGKLTDLARSVSSLKLADEARTLAQRLDEGLFYVACLGQFKRGKSSLINALVGQPILPVGVAPVTSVVTILRYGQTPKIRIRLDGGDWHTRPTEDLPDFVTEHGNTGNWRQVTGVEVYAPSPLLHDGLCLVDTPGVGSVFMANRAETHAFLPRLDAALVVVGFDPPVSAEEWTLIDEVAQRVEHVMLVISKADRATDEDLQEARSFTETIIAQRLSRSLGPILVVSALERKQRTTPTRDWLVLETTLRQWAEGAARSILPMAAARGVTSICRRLQLEFAERRAALIRPLDESQRRMDGLMAAIAEGEQSLLEISYRFLAEQRQLAGEYDAQRQSYLSRALPQAMAELENAMRGAAVLRGLQLRAYAFEQAQRIAEGAIREWFDQIMNTEELRYRHVVRRFVDLANQLPWDDDLAPGPPSEMQGPRATEETGFTERSQYVFHAHMTLTSASPLVGLAYLVRSDRSATMAALRDGQRYLVRLYQTNTSRVVGDLNQRLTESWRTIERTIRTQLREGVGVARRALDAARASHAMGADNVRAGIEHLDRLDAELHDVCLPSPPCLRDLRLEGQQRQADAGELQADGVRNLHPPGDHGHHCGDEQEDR